ncbi:MAG TPA: Trk system potassium transport protein TrkA [Gaiellaceae bacterium]|jgi:trk system potassium uptake protein TrkA|nr:Trk system potassium transport protein TrkA [Gaiellaceae bacterium]
MNIIVLGAGQVGMTIVEALHDEHDVTVIDIDAGRLQALSYRYDVRTVTGNGATRRILQDAGIGKAALMIACTSRDEINLVAAMLAKKLASAQTIVRTSNPEYIEAWQERQIDVDFMVSSELETAYAVSRTIGVPAARQTDVFAEGQVQIVEFDVPGRDERGRVSGIPLTEAAERAAERAAGGDYGEVVGRPLREARIPAESKVASIIRGERAIVPRGDQVIMPGDRVVVIGSPDAAKAWSRIMARGERPIDDVVVFGGGQTGLAIARVLLSQGIRVRLVESREERAREVAEELPEARVYWATGVDADFLERERIGQARAAIFAMREDAKNLYAATLARVHGIGFTIAIVHEPISVEVFERAGIDVAVNPRSVTAEEIVRFAHDPRIRQLAMLEGDRFEILDITVREESKLVGTPFKELPMTGSLIGAIVRDGTAIFPHGEDMLEPGDRAIIFTESRRVADVEKAL